MFAISLSSCSRYNANFKFDQSQCSLFMIVVVYIAHIAANHAMRGPHAGRRKLSDFYEGIPTDSTRSSAYVRVRTWTPRIFHAAEYVRTRTYACGLHTFSTRPDTYVRVRTHVDSTHFPRGRIRTYAYVRMWTPRIRIFRILLRIFRILLRIFRIMARLGPMAR